MLFFVLSQAVQFMHDICFEAQVNVMHESHSLSKEQALQKEKESEKAHIEKFQL